MSNPFFVHEEDYSQRSLGCLLIKTVPGTFPGINETFCFTWMLFFLFLCIIAEFPQIIAVNRLNSAARRVIESFDNRFNV